MLQINSLQKHYGDFSLNCSLQVAPGQITGLIGQNGAGKSTAFKAALGLIPFDGGSVRVLGKDIADFTPRDREALGVVLCDSGFSGYLKIRDIIPILKAMYRDFDAAFFHAQLNRLGLPGDKQIKTFSTGMKAKLKVLAAISHRAKLLLLDEPTAGLDVVARDGLLLLLREFMEEDPERAILISSHISSDLESLCDDVYLIHGGEILLHEDTDVLLSEYALIKISAQQYAALDKTYILRASQEPYGYCCLTNQKRFYLENYPHLAIEKGGIDSIISMMAKEDVK